MERERKAFVNAVRKAVGTGQEVFLVFKERKEGKNFPEGLLGLYELHEQEMLRIHDDHHLRILTMASSGWDEPQHIAVYFKPGIPLSHNLIEELWYWMGRHLSAIFTLDDLLRSQHRRHVQTELVMQ
jgi:hypothetical protein